MTKASDLYEAHIPTSAIPKEPYSVEEIDNHIDADRIRASIKVVRDYSEAIGYEEGHDTGWRDAEDVFT